MPCLQTDGLAHVVVWVVWGPHSGAIDQLGGVREVNSDFEAAAAAEVEVGADGVVRVDMSHHEVTALLHAAGREHNVVGVVVESLVAV